MPATLFSCAVNGLNCELIRVEADILSSQLASFHIVGLGDTAVQEAKERVRAAIKNSNAKLPYRRKVINLAPADLRKQGPSFDLPMAIGILMASDQVPILDLTNSIFVGELALEGNLRHVNGILPIACFCREKGFKRLYLPEVNAFEAGLIPDIEILPIKNLQQIIAHLRGEESISPFKRSESINFKSNRNTSLDMKHIKGQEFVKRSLEIVAAGAHNILFSGPPGSGKTLLARTFQTILPDLMLEESLEITKIYSIAGLLPSDQPLINLRPFRAVHHTASAVSIVGGGRVPKPGEISLAHKGVLFLDEIAEFPVQVLEVLRQPLEDRIISIGRATGTLTFPAHFTLIAAMNPCPCGFASDPDKQCICSEQQIQKYQKKISGPLLDRIDLHVEVPKVNFDKLTDVKEGEISENIKNRVEIARKIQFDRFKNSEIFTNSEMGPEEVKNFCELNQECLDLMRNAMTHLQLSARSFFRILKVARTIADLAQTEKLNSTHISEALQYRRKSGDQ